MLNRKILLIDKSQVTDFIPQRQPIVMVDALEEHEDQYSVSSFKVDDNNIFCKDGLLQEPGLIENIAQTAALRAGYAAARKGDIVQKGFIGSVKRLKIYQLPKVNSQIQTTVTILNELMGASIIKGDVRIAGELIAECEMTIFTGE